VTAEIYPGSELKGGFTVLDLPTREDAVEWARKIAAACRCSQELREFMYDPKLAPQPAVAMTTCAQASTMTSKPP
jgi:hypothetical protein